MDTQLKDILNTVQFTSTPEVRRTSAPPDRLWSVEAKLASVYCTGDNHNKDPITCMICAALNDNKDMNPDNSIIIMTKLNISRVFPKHFDAYGVKQVQSIEQGECMVQELSQDLTKYTRCMVQYLDDYLFKRHLLFTLRPSLQKEVLHRGLTAKFSNIQEILEKSKDIEDSSQYDIGSRMVQEDPILNHSMYKTTPQTSKLMLLQQQESPGSVHKSSRPMPKPQMLSRARSIHIPTMAGINAPLKEGELRCYECGQKGHNDDD